MQMASPFRVMAVVLSTTLGQVSLRKHAAV